MKIGVVADTHSLAIPQQLIEDFKKVDLVIHAGDFCRLEDYTVFRQFKNIKAVFGNGDESVLTKQLPQKIIFNLGAISIGIYHGYGAPRAVFENVQKEFASQKLDIIIFGHSHLPINEKVEDTLYFNPGSPNDIVSAPYCSYGIIDVVEKKIKAKIIKVKDA